MLGREPLVKPSTQFMNFYLAAVGALAAVAGSVDLEHAWVALAARTTDRDARNVLELKQTLLLRPLERLLDNAHVLAGFFGRYDGKLFRKNLDRYAFIGNPLDTLHALYHYLDLELRPGKAPSDAIWDHDQAILDQADAFYSMLGSKLGTTDFGKITAALAGSAPAGFDAAQWDACKASHAGFQLGSELLLLIAAIAQEARFDEVRVDTKLEPVFPSVFTDPKTRTDLQKALAPAPQASSDEIVTPMGGHFYAREAPLLPPLASEGMHFEAGQPLFVIEVMKMFNKVSVPFSGTIAKILMKEGDAKIVAKGQAIFKIEPDHKRVVESPEEVAARKRSLTEKLLSRI
jgi:biotin carboxyl carrier protein